jgi:hypothetical protein
VHVCNGSGGQSVIEVPAGAHAPAPVVLPDKLGITSFPKEDGVDHRVEPPAWLPQGAAPEAADPEPDDIPAVEDAQGAEDSSAAQAESAPEEYSNGNGHDGSYSYSRDDSYHYGEDSPFAEGTSYRSPFTPHSPATTSYAPEEPAPPENGLPGSDAVHSDNLPETGHDLPATGLAGAGPATDSPPGSDLPASGLDDPAMPDTGYPGAAAGFHGTGSGYTDTAATTYPDAVAPYSDPAAPYSDPAAPYSDPAALPYPAAEPLAAAGAAAGETGARYGGTSTEAREQRAAFGAGTTAASITAALRVGKQRSSAKFSRGQASKPRPAGSQARKANLVIARVEPWSVMKFSFLISLVLWIVLFVAVALLYYALSSLGVFGALQRTLASVTSSQTSAGVDLTKWTSATRILGYTMLLGAVDVVLITAISTVGAVIYNLVTHLGGGIEVTLKETD